jgi:tetratricopeptide (TPR) repeat protein
MELSSIGTTASAFGLKEEAERCFDEALDGALKARWPSNMSETLRFVFEDMVSAGFIEKGLEEAPKYKDDRLRAWAYSCIVIAYAQQGKFDKAIRLMPKLDLPDTMVNRLARDGRVTGRILLAWKTIAEGQAKMGLAKEAKKSFSKSLEAALETKSAFSRTCELVEIAEKMSEAGFREEANDAFDKAMEAAKDEGRY